MKVNQGILKNLPPLAALAHPIGHILQPTPNVPAPQSEHDALPVFNA